jgi:hypothetical protein
VGSDILLLADVLSHTTSADHHDRLKFVARPSIVNHSIDSLMRYLRYKPANLAGKQSPQKPSDQVHSLT